MQLAPARALPSTPRSLMPPSPISDTLNSAQSASRTGKGGQGLFAPAKPQSTGNASAAWQLANAPSPTPAGAAKAPTPSAAGGGGAAGSPYDLSTDPIVQKIQALNAATYSTAIGTADAARKQALVDAGFPELAGAAQFGSLEAPTTGDQATALAAGQNTYSTAARLALAHQQANTGIDQTENASNLFYSSDRANKLGDEAHGYLGNVAGAEDQTRQQLSAILQTLLGVRTGGNTDLANGYETARQDAITNAIASGQTFAGYDANGNPIFQPAGGAAAAAPDTGAAPDNAALQASIDKAGGLGAVLGLPAGPGPLTDAFTRTTSGATSFTPAELALIAAMPANAKTKPQPGRVGIQ